MKKLLLMAVFASFISLGAFAQADPGGQTHQKATKATKARKAKKAKKHYPITNTASANRKAINARHRTAVKSVHSNELLTNEQQRELTKQANVAHKQEIKTVTKTTGKKK